MKKPISVILSIALVGLGIAPVALVGQENWKARLENASEPSATLLEDAERRDDVAGLATALTALDGKALAERKGLIARLVPGGDLAGEVGDEVQAQAIAALFKAGGNQRVAAYRLWKIHQLSPSEALQTAALEALKGIPEESLPEGAASVLSGGGGSSPDPAKLARGKDIYMRPAVCFTCHQPNGEGIPAAFPPLAGSEWLDGDTDRLIKIVLKGLMGELTVKGESFNSIMAPLETMLKDDEVADVLTYVRHQWGGGANPDVTTEQVAAIRASLEGRNTPFQVTEILQAHPLGAKE